MPGNYRCHSRHVTWVSLSLQGTWTWSLQSRLWYRKMIFFYNIWNGVTPKYLFDIISVLNDSSYDTKAQSKSELNSILYQNKKASLTLSFLSVSKNGTSWMLKSEIYHPFPDSKFEMRLILVFTHYVSLNSTGTGESHILLTLSKFFVFAVCIM